jgi:glycosyltransferase involved in cell wall biosynthesis
MKVALVYDKVSKWGGAERVLLALHQLFPDAPLYTAVYDKKKAKWADEFDVRTSFLQKIPFAKSHSELLPALMPVAFESFDFDQYDLVISVTSEAAKGIITKSHTYHLCYCLTPTRYLWSGYDDYFKNETARIISKPFISYLQKWDKVASQRPDKLVAISKEVQERIGKYYGREAELVYPPVTLGKNQKSASIKQGGYFLLVSRLSKFTKYKRVDLAIRLANKLKLPLKIVGDGSWRKKLEYMSGPTVEFVGAVSDETLVNYYKNCKALIFPGYEDLGLVMVEAQLLGKPVIAYNKGGAKELVQDGKTGILFDEQTEEGLESGLGRFAGYTFDERACKKNAAKYSFENFKKNFLFVIDKLI